MRLKKTFLVLGIFIFSGLFLRLFNIQENFYYTMDEEVMNLIQRRIVLSEHFPLIGSVSAIGTYLGPHFYYFGAFILFLSSLNPLGQGVFGSLLGVFNILLIYIIAKDLFSKRAGLFASAFYSFSFLIIIFDRRYWHLTPGPFLSLLVLWSLFKIKQGKLKFTYLLTGALIFGINTDYTNLILFLFTAVAWVLFKLPIRRREIFIALLIFLASNAPIVVFDLRHDFLNTKIFLNYFSSKFSTSSDSKISRFSPDRETLGTNKTKQGFIAATQPSITFSRILYTNSNLNISEQHTYCKDYIVDRNKAQGIWFPSLAGILIASFILLSVKHWKDKNSQGYKLVLLFYSVFQVGITAYGFLLNGDVFEHYLATLIPYFVIITAVVVSAIYTKYKLAAMALAVIFILLNINLTFKAANPLSYKNKTEAAKFALDKIGSSKFSLDSISSCFRWDGYYYPFIFQGRYPVKSYQDPNYSWLYNYRIEDKHPERVVVIVSKGRFENQKFKEVYNRYQQWVTERKSFDDLEVLILDNSKGNFY